MSPEKVEQLSQCSFEMKNEKEMKSYFFQHNNVHFTSFNFYKIYMLGKKTLGKLTSIAKLAQIKSKT